MMKNLNLFSLLVAALLLAGAARLFDLATLPARVAEAQDAAQKPAGFEPVAATPAEATSAPRSDTLSAPAEPPQAAAKPDQQAVPPLADEGFSAPEVEVLQSLSKRRAELDAREKRIGEREALLSAASGEVDRKITEMNKLKKELEDLLARQKTTEDERITSLVKIYENMKPKEAAAIFNALDMNVLLPVISKMSERKSSPIIAAMATEKAKLVTVKLAEQRRLPVPPDAAPAPAPKKETAKP